MPAEALFHGDLRVDLGAELLVKTHVCAAARDLISELANVRADILAPDFSRLACVALQEYCSHGNHIQQQGETFSLVPTS